MKLKLLILILFSVLLINNVYALEREVFEYPAYNHSLLIENEPLFEGKFGDDYEPCCHITYIVEDYNPILLKMVIGMLIIFLLHIIYKLYSYGKNK